MDEMEGSKPGEAVAVATTRPALAPVVLPPPAQSPVPPPTPMPTAKVEIEGCPFPEFALVVLKAYLGGPLGLAAFNGTILFTEVPRLYRKMARLIAGGVYGDLAWKDMTDEQKKALAAGI
jgi:hypothetical protein